MKNNILITGGNRGIGLSLIKQFLNDGDAVTVICRNRSESLDKTAATIVSGIDITSYTDIKKAKDQLSNKQFDLVIHNAGLLCAETLDKIDESAQNTIRQQFEINALAPLVLTAELKDQIKEGGKLVLITSRMGSIEDNDSGSRYGYRMSKAALNAVGKSLSVDLCDRSISVGIFHPGWVKTDMTAHSGLLSPDESAENLRARIEDLSMKTTGQFFHCDGSPLPW